jgi:hypothetical protein
VTPGLYTPVHLSGRRGGSCRLVGCMLCQGALECCVDTVVAIEEYAEGDQLQAGIASSRA